MTAAWLLTLLALGGVVIGLWAGQSRALSSHFAAAGGGLLFGIALFWILPEIANVAGWIWAAVLAAAGCCMLAVLDQFLAHTAHSPRHGVIWPLLVAAAAHSFLDGWSVRAFSAQPLTDIAVPIGLGLHKIPEGLALGWVTRQYLSSPVRAAIASASVEAVTLLGAFLEPGANQAGEARFGAGWTAIVLAIIAGGFLFLGFHAVMPARRKPGIIAIFFATLLAVGGWRLRT
ncbi:MAG: hypothetical protein WB992_16900 [Bryobacteraceae bacterium]